MQLDLRYPIGALLSIYGALLIVQGLIAHATILGFNVNLIWGATMLLSGVVSLRLARRAAITSRPPGRPSDPARPDTRTPDRTGSNSSGPR